VGDLRGDRGEDALLDAIESFSQIEDRGRVPDLYQLLGEPDFVVREMAGCALLRLDGINAVHALMDVLAHPGPDGHDFDGLVAMLGEVLETHASEVAPTIACFLRSADAGQREVGVWAAAYARAAIPVDSLLEATWDQDPAVRRSAAGSLASFHRDPGVEDRLLELARDPDPMMRRTVVLTLASLGTERSLAAVRDALDDPTPSVRSAAEEVLSNPLKFTVR
jgi:HEAT repeat protein